MTPGRLRTLEDLPDLVAATVLVRCDLNVPLENGRVTDDLRIRATVPTLRELLDRGATLVVCSHLGRPEGRVVESLRLILSLNCWARLSIRSSASSTRWSVPTCRRP